MPTRREFVKSVAASGATLALPASAYGLVLSDPGSPVEDTAETPLGSSALSPTRGIGVYPGAPAEYFGPSLIPAGRDYRNLALLRPAFHSSSYDFNLTAQLVTDGLTQTDLPEWTSVTADDRVLGKDERELLFDHFPISTFDIAGLRKNIDIHLAGGAAPPRIDRVRVWVLVPDRIKLSQFTFSVLSSPDGHTWSLLGTARAPEPHSPEGFAPNFARGQHALSPAILFTQPAQARFYRVVLEVDPTIAKTVYMQWKIGQVEFYDGTRRVEAGGPYRFASAWKSAGIATEWVYVDLGTPCEFDRVVLHWISPAAEGTLQVSDDAEHWRDLHALTATGALTEEVRLKLPARGRYVRALLTRPATAEGYILSEFEVFGHGGLVARPQPALKPNADGDLVLSGGNWRLHRVSATTPGGQVLSLPGGHLQQGIVATVPGTVLTSYLNAGALPDPNFSDNQVHISDSYFYSDFWYTLEFATPAPTPGNLSWLSFDGTNWNAEVFLNGERLGDIKGGFRRKRFNVTGRLHAGQPNVLAVRIEKNATPGSVKQKTLNEVGKNGGALGADNPTYHASAGWDWIPTIRGRNTGIWGDVTLSTTGAVTVEDPLVTTTLPLPRTDTASVTISATLVNHAAREVRGTLRLHFGELTLSQPVTLAAGASQRITLDPKSQPQLLLKNPKLWWPAGYGDPHLYDVSLDFVGQDQEPARGLRFKAGVRQITATEDNETLRLYINGRRIVPKGGNWGFGESMLRYRAREYDAAVRYHREMNFNIIRNWVGQIGDDALYEACDRHGILLWQDFWLANPVDGPEPHDNALFLDNARDLVARIRMHPCIALYCGRNEGDPPEPLEKGLRSILAELHPEAHYISSSADGPVSGRGPYHALPRDEYFRIEDPRFHSEIGAPAIPPIESVQAMMPKSSLWPQGQDWGLHDFCLHGAQGGLNFLSLIDTAYGGADNAKDWIDLAQFINYDTYRAMFEAQGQHRMGVLLWMSHPCWPSFVWQTYDYYFEPTSAYFGCKKAAEPLHIQWNSATNRVEVVNSSAGSQTGLTATVEVLDPHGAVLAHQTATLSSAEDTVSEPLSIQFPEKASDVHLVRLTLKQREITLSTNTYLRGRVAGDYRAIRTWGVAHIAATTTTESRNNTWQLTTHLKNISEWPALMLRLKAVRTTTGDRILPAIYSDNYLTLMPGETCTVTTELNHADARGEHPRIVLSGFNVRS